MFSMLKTCSTCQEEKPQSAFRKDKSKKDGYQHSCKVCARAYHKSAYMARYSDKVKVRNKRVHGDVKEAVLKYKATHPCEVCGEDDPCCLDFHHRDPNEKDFTIAGRHMMGLTRIVVEIQKCAVLCSNCHRKVHAGVLSLLPLESK